MISPDSVVDRGLYHDKNEPLCHGHNRLHILFGESLCSQVGNFLKVGATAIIVAMAEAGIGPGVEVQLDSPLDALRTVAADLTLGRTLKLRGGGRMTAIEIQRAYLRKAEENLDCCSCRHLRRQSAWSGGVCSMHWIRDPRPQ